MIKFIKKILNYSNKKEVTLSSNSFFHFQGIRALSYTIFEGADIGESLIVLGSIEPSNEKSWYKNWYKVAERLNNEAHEMLQNNHLISARETLLRASNYYRASEFFLRSKEDLPLALEAFNKSKSTFSEAIKYFPNKIELINIPFEEKFLPGYFICSNKQDEKRPLIIFQTGFDGTAEELFFYGYQACIERNYNCLIFEGPGQGNALRKYNFPFRHNWESVITPVLDFIIEYKKTIDVDRIALVGCSMGGYLVPRALAFEHRIKLGVVNGGMYDFHKVLLQGAGTIIKGLLENSNTKKILSPLILNAMKKDIVKRWCFEHGMYTFKKCDPVAFLLETKKYALTKEQVESIKSKMLVIESDNDTLVKLQSKIFYDMLKGEKSFLKFKTKEGAGAHCQLGAQQLSKARIFNWIDSNI